MFTKLDARAASHYVFDLATVISSFENAAELLWTPSFLRVLVGETGYETG